MTPADLNGSIIAHRNDRMGARIISMLNAIRIARDYDLPWFCGWTTGGRTHEECRDPTMIFDEGFVADRFFDTDVLAPIINDLVDLSTLGDKATKDNFAATIAKGRRYLAGNMMGVIALPWEDPETVARDVPKCIDAFQYSAPVAAMVEEIDQMFAGTRLTALHIRRGDIIHDQITSNKLWPNKYIPREFYEVHLDRLLEDPTTRVLVFSDTPQEVTRLKAKSDRVMGIDDLFGARDFTSGARDFLELFAMSRCKMIYGPPSSAFSQTATTIGGGQIEAVQDALTPADQARAMDLMTQRLEEKSDLFINMGDVGQCLHFLIEHQMAKGNPGRAKRIIRAYMDDGLDKSFAYQLLCELSAATGDLAYVERVRDIAYKRPVYVDESLATLNAYSGLHQLAEGDWDLARERLTTAAWFRPLEPMVHGALSLGLSAGAITPENFFPFDPEMTRRKGAVFPQGKKALADLNSVVPKGLDPEGRREFHPWDIVVRDWRIVMGKRLNRAFSNKSKIVKTHQMLERSFKKMEGTAALISALGVLRRGMGDLEDALNAQRAAIAKEPENPLYRKRVADVLFETKAHKTALFQLEKAHDLSGQHPCYAAELAQQLWWAKRRKEARALHDRLAASNHLFVEIRIMTADMLRRDSDRTKEALDQLNLGLAQAHGAQRLMTAKARLLMTLNRVDEAQAIYEDIVNWGLGTEHTFVDIYRQFARLDRPEVARDLTDRSPFDYALVREMAEG